MYKGDINDNYILYIIKKNPQSRIQHKHLTILIQVMPGLCFCFIFIFGTICTFIWPNSKCNYSLWDKQHQTPIWYVQWLYIPNGHLALFVLQLCHTHAPILRTVLEVKSLLQTEQSAIRYD